MAAVLILPIAIKVEMRHGAGEVRHVARIITVHDVADIPVLEALEVVTAQLSDSPSFLTALRIRAKPVTDSHLVFHLPPPLHSVQVEVEAAVMVLVPVLPNVIKLWLARVEPDGAALIHIPPLKVPEILTTIVLVVLLSVIVVVNGAGVVLKVT